MVAADEEKDDKSEHNANDNLILTLMEEGELTIEIERISGNTSQIPNIQIQV
uniref:Uncharacterized protein n=1 Tax=Arion vulgaris TaxID=1028688 RepID=A0A0B6Y4U4_9EUPU